MKIKILNEEYGIGSCNVKDIPKWVTKFGCAKDAVFFYCKERDWIVLNEDNVNYEFYKSIIEGYLLLDNEQKRDLMILALKTDIRIYRALQNLNWIIRVRRKLYKSMVGKVGVKHETD